MSDWAANTHMSQLQDLCDFVRGVTFEQYEGSQSPAEGLVPILRAGNIGAELLLDRDLVYVPQSRVSPEQLLQQGDSVICMSSGSALVVGKSAYLGHSWAGSVGAFCGIIRPRRATVEPRWLSLWMRSNTFIGWRDSQARGANIQNLRFSELGSIPVRVPTLPEQKRIAAKLDKQMATLASAQAALAAQREAVAALRSAVLRAALDPVTHPDWPMVSIGSICRLNPVRPPLVRDDSEPTSFVPMSAVDELAGTIPLLAERPYGEVKKGYTCFQEGDVLFAKITPCMQNGKSAIARGLVDRLGFGSTEFHVLRPSAGVTSEWIHLWLRQQHILEDAARHFTGAVGQQRVPADYLALLNIPLPPLSEQHRIAEYLDGSMKQVDSMVASLDSQVATLDSLCTSLLDAAFSGQV